MKKNAIAAEDVDGCPILSKMAIIIIQTERAAQPQIIVHRRPMRSRYSAGTVLPIGNMIWMKPAMSKAVFGSTPTLETRTVGV
jgi:hypothetical protein